MPPGNRIVYPVRSSPRRSSSRRRWYILGALVAAGLIAGGVIFILNLSSLRIDTIEVTGATQLSSPAIESEVRSTTAGFRAFVIPRNNFFLVSSRRVAAHLREAFPGAAAITVAKDFPDRIIVTVEERLLWGVYCE